MSSFREAGQVSKYGAAFKLHYFVTCLGLYKAAFFKLVCQIIISRPVVLGPYNRTIFSDSPEQEGKCISAN